MYYINFEYYILPALITHTFTWFFLYLNDKVNKTYISLFYDTCIIKPAL